MEGEKQDFSRHGERRARFGTRSQTVHLGLSFTPGALVFPAKDLNAQQEQFESFAPNTTWKKWYSVRLAFLNELFRNRD
jgi:hypothetical protein